MSGHFRGAGRPFVFQIDQTTGFQPIARIEHGNIVGQGVLAERRVEKCNVKRLCGGSQVSGGAHFKDPSSAFAAQADELFLQSARGGRHLFDKGHFRRTPRQRFQPDHTGACE